MTARTRKTTFITAVIAGFGLFAVSPLGAFAATQSVHTGTTNVGKVLVSPQGKTLYVFSADTKGKSNCLGACLRSWPAVTTMPATGHSSGVTAKLGVLKRSDGIHQLTVNGLPVYTYAGDRVAGQANGQGLNASGGLWWVLGPNGARVIKTPPSDAVHAPAVAPTTSETGSTGGAPSDPYSY